jgi:Family of unknown function (DUF6134)
MAEAGAIARRSLLTGLLAMGAQQARAGTFVPYGGEVAFRLVRHGSSIGMHHTTFRRDGESLAVNTSVDVAVGFGPITLVRYTHQSVELWQRDRLIGLSGQTNRNGTRLHMDARWTDGGLAVQGSGTKPYVAPANAWPTTYWNPHMLLGPMIGTQDGGLVKPAVIAHPHDAIRLASGNSIDATHYRLSGDLDLDLWYDDSSTWSGMRFTVDDGSSVTYERL